MNARRFLALALCGLMLWAAAAARAQGLRPSAAGLGHVPAAAAAPAPPADPAPTPVRQADYIAAVVNSEPITNNEVQARMAREARELAQQGQPVPPAQAFARQTLERMINEKAQLKAARDSGVRVDDAAVDQAEQSIARQNRLTLAEFRRQIQREGIDPQQFREDLRNQLMLQRLRDRELEPSAKVSDQEVDQFLREQRSASASAATPPEPAHTEINIAQVLVAVPENASPAQVSTLQAKAQQIADQARAGADFAALARQFSDAPERAAGGALGLRLADRYPNLFADATQRLAVGGIAGPLRSGAGFHVLKLLERRETPDAAAHGAAVADTVVQSHVRHILLNVGPKLSEAEARARLAEYKRRIQSGMADFAALAREFSQDGSARQGGDLGWTTPGTFVPEFEDVVDGLAPGQISDPVTTRFGVHLVQLLDRREVPISERDRREMARNHLHEKKLDDAYAAWAQDIRARAYVELREPPQ